MRRLLLALLVLSWTSWSADLNKIERRVAKAPRYSSPVQYHALLVLGEKADYRVWVVVDGDTLYLDKNGDGDLRGPGERFQVKSKKSYRAGFLRETRNWMVARLDEAGRYTDVEVEFRFVNREWKPEPDWGDVEFFRARMKSVRAGKHPNWTKIGLTIGGKRKQFCGVRFATTAAEAPIVHMDGPLTLGIVCSLMKFEFGLGMKLKVAVGTPGLGTATFSYVMYNEIPEEARPFAIVAFPGLEPKRYDLKEKC